MSQVMKVFLETMRLPFLVLPLVCVGLGAATAAAAGDINIIDLMLVLAGGIAAHISVNALNEYDDFKTGLDFKTKPTPFSGGSGALPKNPQFVSVALLTGMITLLLTVVIGLYFTFTRGVAILPLGMAGIILVLTYTRWLTHSPFFCLIAPGLGFGPLMVMGTHFVLTGSYSLTALTASLAPFFLVSNLLLLNQFPDIEADVSIGRHHFPISIGIKSCVKIYGLFLCCAYAVIVCGCLSGILPVNGLVGLLSIFLAIPTLLGIIRTADSIPDLIPYMAKNVILVITTPALLALGIYFN